MFSRAQIGKSRGIDTTVRANIPGVSPTWEWVQNYKSGLITSDEYTQWYVERLNTHRAEVLQWASRLDRDAVFLCYCRDGDFCHTYLLMDWLKKQKTMKIGFTGTQEGMSHRQLNYINDYMWLLSERGTITVTEAHHGDCVGADKEFHDIIRKIYPKAVIHGHPPTNPSKRAFCDVDVEHPKKEYLKRNKDIVDAVDVMFATPKENTEVLRSGTWSTIRYTRKKGRLLRIAPR